MGTGANGGGDPRAAFDGEERERWWQGARTACLLLVTLCPLFGLLDAVVVPEHARGFFLLRLLTTAAAGVVWWVLGTPLGRRRPADCGLATLLIAGLMVAVMTVFTGRDASPYYAGINLIMLAAAMVMAWSPSRSAVGSLLLIGSYVGLLLATGPIAQPRIFVNNLYFLAATGIVAFVNAILQRRQRWETFGARVALEEALRHKSEFFASMSHELRTPLHVVIGYTDILLEGALDADARGLVERIRGRSVFLHGMITDLLDVAKIDAGKMDVQVGTVAIAEVVEQVTESFRPLVVRKGLRLDVRCPPALPPVTTDRRRLEQILANLVGNAVKFTATGGVTISVEPATDGGASALAGFGRLGDPVSVASSCVIVRVDDSGIGIRSSDLARLAEDFHQVDGAAAGQYGGSGLGLSISRKLATLLGGWIAVRSCHGEGASFVLVLPVQAEALRAAA